MSHYGPLHPKVFAGTRFQSETTGGTYMAMAMDS